MEKEGAEKPWFLNAPTARATYSECTGGVTCTFEGNLKLQIRMDAAGSYFGVGEELEKPKFTFIEGSKIFCGESTDLGKGRTRLDWRLDDKSEQSDKTLGTIHKTSG